MEKGMFLSEVCLHHDIPAWMLHCNLQTVVAFQYEKKICIRKRHIMRLENTQRGGIVVGKKKIKDEVKKN